MRTLAERLARDALVQTLLEGYPEIVVVLNRHRQIVACNSALPSLLKRPKDELIGQRVGEVFGCPHAFETPGGCGTSESCRLCGAAQAMVECIDTGRATRRECSLSAAGGTLTFDLAVLATSIKIDQDELTIFAIRDVSSQKRRDLLESIFFHDALNLAGGIQGLSELVARGDEVDFRDFSGRLHLLAGELVEQIRAQRDLQAAERGELRPQLAVSSALRILEETRAAYELHPVAFGRRIDVQVPRGGDVLLDTDPMLLCRVLGNLTKNALEASAVGEAVVLSCERTPDDVAVFEVHNQAVMSRDVQLQLFNRSFSTKGGAGRGLGTFSVRLLTERYLGGRVVFRSSPGHGTTFHVRLPALPSGADLVDTARTAVGCSLDGRRVLLVDDSPDMLRIVARHLECAGARALPASHGFEALQVYERAVTRHEQIDAILLDAEMPMMGGLEAAGRLRGLGYRGPILLLTADDTVSTRDAALSGGCDDLLQKPIERVKLLRAIDRAICTVTRSGPLQTA